MYRGVEETTTSHCSGPSARDRAVVEKIPGEKMNGGENYGRADFTSAQ